MEEPKQIVPSCGLLAGKRGLILGALDSRSIAWHVAEQCIRQGGQLVLSNSPAAISIGEVKDLAARYQVPLIPCDMTQVDEIRQLLRTAQHELGGKIDFVLHAVAQSMNLRRHRDYSQVNYDYYMQTVDTSAMSLHKLLQTAMEEDAMAPRGSVVTLTYLASEYYMQGYNDMADAKAMLASIVRQMGAVYGEKNGVRVNAVCQSAIPTKAGGQFEELEQFYAYADALSPLGNADADDCAGVCVALFSDLMQKVTMQTIYNDGGMGRTMLTTRVMDRCRK